MWEGSYGKEPFDFKLTMLRLIRNLHAIIFVTLAGTLLFGGGYYVKNVLLQGKPDYAATSVYKVTYADEPTKSGDYYINEMSWNTYVHSTDFLNAVWEHLQKDTAAYDFVYVQSKEQLSEMIAARLDSDVHIPITVVTTKSPQWSLVVARAVEETMTLEFVESNSELSDIHVMTPAENATLVEPDVRPARAFALSGILSCFFAVVIFLLRELAIDSIWLPATLRMRYGLAAVGTLKTKELAANLEYCFRGKKKVAVCAVDENIDLMEVVKKLPDMAEWFAVPTPIGDTKDTAKSSSTTQTSSATQSNHTEQLREAEGCLLVVKAGSHAGKPLEYLLEYFALHDISVTAVLLWEADETLLTAYYGLKRKAKI